MMEEFRPNRVAERIIRQRGELPSQERDARSNDPEAYQAFIITEGFPMMGFSVFCVNGKRHGFFYHNIDSLDLDTGKRGEYLKLTHRGKAMTIRGRGMHDLFQAIMDHTLQAVYEYSDAIYPAPAEGEPIIDRVRVDDVSIAAKPG